MINKLQCFIEILLYNSIFKLTNRDGYHELGFKGNDCQFLKHFICQLSILLNYNKTILTIKVAICHYY